MLTYQAVTANVTAVVKASDVMVATATDEASSLVGRAGSTGMRETFLFAQRITRMTGEKRSQFPRHRERARIFCGVTPIGHFTRPSGRFIVCPHTLG
jgi:hypothetical protein